MLFSANLTSKVHRLPAGGGDLNPPRYAHKMCITIVSHRLTRQCKDGVNIWVFGG